MIPPNVVLLSFEGPDLYSTVGGLATRVCGLAQALADRGVRTRLFFVGDPALPAFERATETLELYRWCQWISEYHPHGVYDGERGKVLDFAGSAPPFVLDQVVAPACGRGERVLVIAEEWQTVPAVLHLDRALRERGFRDAVTIVWNANNTYGFDSVDWQALQSAAVVTAVSRYMKCHLALRGANDALVIPNGISHLPFQPQSRLARTLDDTFAEGPLYVKVARFHEDKRWFCALEGIALLRAHGIPARLIARGGGEAYGSDVIEHARECGLRVGEVTPAGSASHLCAALGRETADVTFVRGRICDELLYALYAFAAGVLANSAKEPFGLVGLEAMAAGGIAVVGSTGEDYAQPDRNALVCDSGDPRELAAQLERSLDDRRRAAKMRERARKTAARYRWPCVLETLSEKIEFARERAYTPASSSMRRATSSA